MTDERRQTDEGQESQMTSELLDGRAAFAAGAAGEATGIATTQLGSARYVHASFIAAATLVGYITAQVFTLIWNRLAEAPWALRLIPQLVQYDEDMRGDFGLMVGAVAGIIAVVRIYKRPKIRIWADEVAAELAKVTWPDRESVTNNTVIVIVASLVATMYVAVLDRFWAFSTGLIYAP
jgi:preprotein translocase subunit SecE